MQKLLSLLVLVLITVIVEAKVSKTINVKSAGEFTNLLTENEKSNVTDLTITGFIDASDVKSIRDEMTVLAFLDISAVSIVEYNGKGGTCIEYSYPANEMPRYSFYNTYTTKAKTTLKTINFPTTITKIGDYAFYYCSGLTSVRMPDSVTNIGMMAFWYCSGLTSLTIGSMVNYIGVYAFEYCTGLTSVIIPNEVITIGGDAFYKCTGLISVTIGSKVRLIDMYAFVHCNAIKEIYVLNPTPPTIGEGCFTSTIVEKVYVPTLSVKEYKDAPGWSDFFKSVIVANNNTSTAVIINNRVNIYTNHLEIIVEGTAKGETVMLYTINGTLIKIVKSKGEQLKMHIDGGGVYLVKAGIKTFKVIL